MARENEMQEFTRSFFQGRPDLSTLTHSIVRRRFLAHAGRDHLEPEEKQALKRLVEEELLKMQGDEAGAREKRLDIAKKAKRSPTPCRDPARKRFRFNSESEPSSAASSPDCFSPPAKNGMAAEVSPAEDESPQRASKKAIEKSSDEEEQQRDLTAKMALEKELAKESSEEEAGSPRKSKVQKEGSSEEEEDEEKEEKEDKEEKESKGRTRKKPGTKDKQAPDKASASRKQAREESEDSEEEPAQGPGRKAERKKGAKSQQESEKESEEEEETLPKENREEEEDWKPTAQSNGEKREERSCKQKSRAARLLGDQADTEEQKERAAAGSGDSSGEDEEPLVQRKSTDRTQWKGGKRQSGSSEEDGEDSWRKVTPTTGKTAKEGNINGEASDSEKEVSDSEAEEIPKERKNRSSKKSSKKSRTRSSSSSSTDGSPEHKDRKGGSGRPGEDHPAVMRLKRYIRACGAHRNYKKLLGSCRSHKERLSVLRAELEALGMKGNPSLEKCRALKEQREEAAEVASLDITNIISSSGRPRRRTAWNPSGEAAPPGELYRRTLDSEEERPRPPPPDWSHMRGIISSDGESN
ncbi:HIRA-interacting protein 3 [Hippopotamus amphibius kiboko]|uniref:HIRA-interacting protein 3 n=1 Tax=Hippopotamus amphibius kiboko TaxID=575201 RepID=UPI00259ACDA9|nr:HIRA-interacting protein 3 [Hippopotamus amphibius kiboko]